MLQVGSYRNNACKHRTGRYDFSSVVRRSVYYVTRAYSENWFRAFSPARAIQKFKKRQTPLPHSNSKAAAAAGVDHVATHQHRLRRPAPIKELSAAQTLGEACAVMVKWRPRGRANRRPLPRLLRRCYSADHSLMYTLQAVNWSVQ